MPFAMSLKSAQSFARRPTQSRWYWQRAGRGKACLASSMGARRRELRERLTWLGGTTCCASSATSDRRLDEESLNPQSNLQNSRSYTTLVALGVPHGFV